MFIHVYIYNYIRISSVAFREATISILSRPHCRQQLRLTRSPWDDLSASQMATANLGGKNVNRRFLCYQGPATGFGTVTCLKLTRRGTALGTAIEIYDSCTSHVRQAFQPGRW